MGFNSGFKGLIKENKSIKNAWSKQFSKNEKLNWHRPKK